MMKTLNLISLFLMKMLSLLTETFTVLFDLSLSVLIIFKQLLEVFQLFYKNLKALDESKMADTRWRLFGRVASFLSRPSADMKRYHILIK